MNERKPTWNCPVCDKQALYETLVIDGYVSIDDKVRERNQGCNNNVVLFLYIFSYFQEVLQSSLLPSDTNEITLLKDGSWTTHDSSSDSNCLDTPRKSTQKVEVISDDIGKDNGLIYLYLSSNLILKRNGLFFHFLQ